MPARKTPDMSPEALKALRKRVRDAALALDADEPVEETRTVPRELTDADVEEILYQLNRKETGDPWTAERVRDLYRTFLFVVARYPKSTP